VSPRPRACAALVGVVVAGAIGLASRDAAAAPPWVDRPITLPGGTWAFDLGLGISHVPAPPDEGDVAAGINLEAAVGLTNRVELGFRTGLRIGDGFDRSLHGDEYGRLFDRQYVDGGADVLANPEVRVRGALVRGPVAELGLEGRLFVPVEAGTEAALEFGVPIALHLGGSVRLDTGVYVPILFAYATPLGLSVPLDVWIQVTPRLWLGPMTGVRVARLGDHASETDVSMGFGLGYQIARIVDFKTMFLFPALNQDSRVFGLGAGVQIRIE
jgi:hypothetical protein